MSKRSLFKNKLIDSFLKRSKSHQKTSTEARNTPHYIKENNDASFINKLYRKVSGDALSVAVKPKLLGDLPPTLAENKANDEITLYVLQEHSHSNSILLDLQTQEYDLFPALSRIKDSRRGIDEDSSIIFLNSSHRRSSKHKSERLERLVTAIKENPEQKISLIPVTIIWGRAPEKEDSLFKLFMADDWEDPGITKQLFNIGVMGRDTFIQFHKPHDLATLINQTLTREDDGNFTYQPIDNTNQNDTDTICSTSKNLITNKTASIQIVHRLRQYLNIYLDKQRANILGPDLSDKRNVCDKIIYSPAVQKSILKEIENTGKDKEEVKAQARKYLDEIVTDYSYPIVRLFENFLTWLWTQLYDGVEVQNFERVRDLASDYQIIYVPSHRSHIDYLLLSFVIYKKGLRVPSIAAGNNLNLPVVGQLLRNGGAFFMRRSFKDNQLYSTVFKEYLHSLILRNNPIEYFIEGGRSRTGRLLPPRLGMISMTVQSYLRQSNRPIVFVPTYIGYERLMEGSTYIGELKGQPKEAESLIGVMKVARKLEKIFGTVHLSFGKPLFVDDFMEKFEVEGNSIPIDDTNMPNDKNLHEMINNLGVKILQNINRAAVVNPVSLISLVLLSTPKLSLDEESCREQIALYQSLIRDLPYDEDTSITDMCAKEIIEYGIKLKLIERTPHLLGDMITVDKSQAALLSYFRNNVLHVYILSSFISALVIRNGCMTITSIQDIVKQLYPFLQSELFLKFSNSSIDDVVIERIDNLIAHNLLVRSDNVISAPDINSKEHNQLDVLAKPIEQSLERYIMTLTLLAEQGSGKLSKEQVINLCSLLGQRLSILHADDIPDAFDKALFTNFLETLMRLGYITNDKDKDVLTFDHRINDIAVNARYILMADVMQVLKNVAGLEEKHIEKVTLDIKAKKQRKFGRNKK